MHEIFFIHFQFDFFLEKRLYDIILIIFVENLKKMKGSFYLQMGAAENIYQEYFSHYTKEIYE